MSSSAPAGKFILFQDTYLIAHLSISDVQSIQHFDSSLGRWITILRNSPPLRIVPKSTHHFKLPSSDVKAENIVLCLSDSTILSTASTVSKRESDGRPDVFSGSSIHAMKSKPSAPALSGVVVDLSDDEIEDADFRPDTPCPSPRKSRSLSFSPPLACLNRPSVSAEFPPALATEMDIRLKWIDRMEGKGSLQKRFSSVFNCEFRASTFHKHWAAWRWLRANGHMDGLVYGCRWKTLVGLTPVGRRKSTQNELSQIVKAEDIEFGKHPEVIVLE